jgi:hypothetical protein
LLSRYQTGPFVTIAAFAIAIGFFVFGFVDALHFHHRMGWIRVAYAPLLFWTFHQRYFRDAK